MDKILVQARDLKKRYLLGAREVWALRGVTFTISSGEFLAFVGSSGSGKTTLLNLVGGLDLPTSGQLIVDGQDTTRLNDDELSKFRSHRLGFVFQTFNLIPVLTAKENVEYPLIQHAVAGRESHERATALLERVGLGDHLNHRPDQLSGGQRQRVAIARALVHNPHLVIADEPTANLDKRTALEILSLMRGINRDSGVTFLFSTHDPLIIKEASRTIEISDGEIVR